MKAYHYTTVPSEAFEGKPGISIRWAMGKNVGAPNFTARVIDMEPGTATPYHTHAWEHEVFVLEGDGVVRDAGGETPIGPGHCVYVEPGEVHQFINRGESVLRIICVIPNPAED